jgi:hypothetical protein
MVSLSNHDGAGSADCPSINSGQAISSPFDKLRVTRLFIRVTRLFIRVILRQAQGDKRFVMVSLSNHDGAGSADCPSINSGQAISSPFPSTSSGQAKLRVTKLIYQDDKVIYQGDKRECHGDPSTSSG